MSISFSTIPPDLKIPLFYAEFDNSMAGATLPSKRALILGQAIGVAGGTPSPVWVASPADAASQFGAASQLAAEVAAYRANDPATELWTMPYADAQASVAAAGAVTFGGEATAPGVIPLRIGGVSVATAVAAGDSATAATAKVLATMQATPSLPVNPTGNTATLSLTARNKGTLGNSIPISLAYYGARGGEAMPPGLTCTITPMSGGAGDPDLSGLAAAIAAMEFDFIVSPWTSGAELAATTAMMNDRTGRWSYKAARYGHVFSAKQDTAANLLAFGATLNDPHLSVLGTYGSPTPDYVWAAAFAGAAAPPIKADPARPLQTIPILGVLAPPEPMLFPWDNNQALLSTGIALPAVAQDGSVSIMRCVTTYQVNRYGVADQSYLDFEALATLAEITRRLKAATTQKFPRAKLADDGTRFGPGQPVVTPSIYRAEIIAQYRQMEYDGLVEDADAMAKATIVDRNAGDPSRLDVLWAPYLVSGLRIVALLNQFRLLSADAGAGTGAGVGGGGGGGGGGGSNGGGSTLQAPGAVTGLAASNETTTTVDLAWTAPSSGGAVASYSVRWSLHGANGWTAISVSGTSTTLTGLAAGTSYDFEVEAVNATGNGGWTAAVTAATTASAGNYLLTLTGTQATNIPTTGLDGSGNPYAHGASGIVAQINVNTASGDGSHTAPTLVSFAWGANNTTAPTTGLQSADPYSNGGHNMMVAYIATPASAGTYYLWAIAKDGGGATVATFVWPCTFTIT